MNEEYKYIMFAWTYIRAYADGSDGTYLRYGKLSRLINMVPKTRMVISFIMTTEGASNFKVHPESEPITYSVNCYGELSTQ